MSASYYVPEGRARPPREMDRYADPNDGYYAPRDNYPREEYRDPYYNEFDAPYPPQYYERDPYDRAPPSSRGAQVRRDPYRTQRGQNENMVIPDFR